MTDPLAQARDFFLRGVADVEAGRLADARSAFEAALARAPGRASVLQNLGVVRFRLGDYAQAIDALQQASTADPGPADSWAYAGLAHEALGQWAPAIAALEQAVQRAPGHAELWLALGRCRERVGAAGPALEALERACTLDATLAEAWSRRGGLLRDQRRLGEAGQCFERAIALGADPELHRFYLASVRASESEEVPPAPPRRYVETLFDEYAAEFQHHLVDQLHYQAPDRLLRPLMQAGRRYRSVLDLGCGSGLCGRLIHPLADAIDGVDLSGAMLAQARALGVYRVLAHADVAQFVAGAARQDDLVLAADVFIYVGDLSAVFDGVRRLLVPGGTFAFTVERATGDQDLQLLPSLRYAHSETYLRQLAVTFGFTVRELVEAPLREDQGQPVMGLYAYLE
jgi:predicted TPR repeat methyltransferase